MKTMRTMILALAVILLAAPAWAVVYITATHLGDGVVAIDYDSSEEPNLPRAFALDITVSAGNITECNDYAIGDDNGGFGIFPGNFGVIYVDPNGLVASWEVSGYTPVADPCTHDTALGGIGTPGITVEMGSLYVNNAPNNVGRLCTVTAGTLPCTLSVTLNALSGGVVLEDPNLPVDVDLAGATDVPIGVEVECMKDTDPNVYAAWEAAGKPECWCYEFNCKGDADGYPQFGKQVMSDDLAILASAYGQDLPSGDLRHCADFDRKPQFGKRVMSDDLAILASNYGQDITSCPDTHINLPWLVPPPK